MHSPLIGAALICLLYCFPATAQQGRPQVMIHSPALTRFRAAQPAGQPGLFYVTSSRPQELTSLLNRSNIKLVAQRNYGAIHFFALRTSLAVLDSLARVCGCILYADVHRAAREEMAVKGQDFTTNRVTAAQQQYPTITGQALALSIKENLFDTSDIDLHNRYRLLSTSPVTIRPHATIMATIAAGGGNSYFNSRGVAPDATVFSADFALLLPDPDSSYLQNHITVQNHSYGTGIENYYAADAAAYDAMTWEHPSLLHVFSAGNEGAGTDTSGIYGQAPGFATITGSFKMAKNIVTVGATDSFSRIDPLSSRGPAYDGRIEPTLTAFGLEGSSGAAALTSGTALLLQQAWGLRHNGALPDAALVKAILINTTDDQGNPGPDFTYGYGTLNTRKALEAVYKDTVWKATLHQDETLSYSLTIPEGLAQLQLTACWTDTPAMPGSARALVNDLDLSVITPGGDQQLPWILHPFPATDSLLKPAVTGRDSLNNVEQVTLYQPTPGVYQVQLKGSSVLSQSQTGYITAHAEMANQFDWEFPTHANPLPAGNSVLLRWRSTLTDSTGSLYIQTDKDPDWQLLDSAVALRAGYHSLQLPEQLSTVQLRMSTRQGNFNAEQFLVSPRLRLYTGFACNDSLMLYWHSVPGAVGYQLYRLGNTHLEPWLFTTDTLVVAAVTTPPQLFYSIAPLYAGREGVKEYATNYTTQGSACYTRFLVAERLNNDQALLTLELSSLYKVDSIVMEKKNGNEFRPWTNLSPGGLQYTAIDSNLHPGVNTYRARIVLKSRYEALSEEASLLYQPASLPLLLYPNPIARRQPLYINWKEPGKATLLLYNSYGQLVFQQTLDISPSTATIPLAAGIYFCRLQTSNGTYTSRLQVVSH